MCVQYCVATTGDTAAAFVTASKAGRGPNVIFQSQSVRSEIAMGMATALPASVFAGRDGLELPATRVIPSTQKFMFVACSKDTYIFCRLSWQF